MNHIEFDTNI